MNLVRINDTHQFVWMIDEQATIDLIKFLHERGHKVHWEHNRGISGDNQDKEAQ